MSNPQGMPNFNEIANDPSVRNLYVAFASLTRLLAGVYPSLVLHCRMHMTKQLALVFLHSFCAVPCVRFARYLSVASCCYFLSMFGCSWDVCAHVRAFSAYVDTRALNSRPRLSYAEPQHSAAQLAKDEENNEGGGQS